MTKSWNTLRIALTTRRMMIKKNNKQEPMKTNPHSNPVASLYLKQSQVKKTLKSIISSIMTIKTKTRKSKMIKVKWLKFHRIIIKIKLLLLMTLLSTHANLLKSKKGILSNHLKSQTDRKWMQKHFRKTLISKLWSNKLHSCKNHC